MKITVTAEFEVTSKRKDWEYEKPLTDEELEEMVMSHYKENIDSFIDFSDSIKVTNIKVEY